MSGSCLKEFGVVCTLGNNKKQVCDNLLSGENNYLVLNSDLPLEEPQYVGQVQLPNTSDITTISTHNNKLAFLAFQQIKPCLQPLIKQYGEHRIAVVIGTSTASIFEGELARKALDQNGHFPESFHYQVQEMSAPATYIAQLANAKGPVYGISTACSSSGKTLVSAKALLDADLADVVIAGGVDSLTQLTVNGFQSLESISKSQCKPFSKDRDGINIGEAAALFVVTKDSDGIQLLGAGETSDAYHISAPAPDGEGAIRAISLALNNAQLSGEQISYVNLHGTGTIKNDEMEAQAMLNTCGTKVPCSSTKHLTGHTLGASGALELGLCWLLLSDYNSQGLLPKNYSDNEIVSSFPMLNLNQTQAIDGIRYCMSNSFAFGGNNFSAVLGKADE
jgi:3-oxoacyl-[acyl-carrier-protein] synthase-1